MEIQTILAFVTILSHIVLAISIGAFLFSRSCRTYIRTFAYNFGFIASFFIALVGMLGSLYFSDVVGWVPCILCWYQRIALYPLVVIFAIGVWKQEASAQVYGLVLAIIGLVISLYQIYIQIASSFGEELQGFCSAIGATDCSEIYMQEFGYITFPVVSATAFLYIVLLQLVRKF